MADRAQLQQLMKRLADDGKVIEAGWMAMRISCISDKAPAVQLREMRMAYMAGAQHVFSTMMNVLDEGTEPTDDDMKRMTLIANELEAFQGELERWAKEPR